MVFFKLPQFHTSNFRKVVRQHTEGMVGSTTWVLLEIYLAFQQWKNFENPLRIDKVIAMSSVCNFFWPTLYVCVCVCPSRSCILSKRISISSTFFHYRVTKPFYFSDTKRHDNIPTGTSVTGTSNAGVVGRNRDSEPISGFMSCCERCDGQLLSTRLSADIWLSIDAWWNWCYQLTVVRPVVYHSHGASLFTAQKATHQWICRREEKNI